MSTSTVARAGTFDIGGTTVNRLGFGTMQLTGPGVWGEPDDRDEAIRVLRRAAELDVNFIDTADSYGPVVAEQLIHEALHPYSDDLVIATKAGLTRHGPGIWKPVGRPGVSAPAVRDEPPSPRASSGSSSTSCTESTPRSRSPTRSESCSALQEEGKIHHIGLSEVSVEELVEAQQTAEIASVQNLYNLIARRRAAARLRRGARSPSSRGSRWPPATCSERRAAAGAEPGERRTPSQLALAWLLQRSPVMLPIPGTSSVGTSRRTWPRAEIELSDEQFEELTAVGA